VNERSVDVLSLNHVMGDVEIVDSLVTDNRPVHEVWRLKSTGEILVWSGDPTMTQFWIWDSEGLLKGLQLPMAAKQCVLLPDESHLAIQLNDVDFLLLDTRTWGKSLQTTFLREYWIDRQISRPDFSKKLAEKGLSALESTVEHLTGDMIWDVAFNTGGSKVLVWTAAWVHPPGGYSSVPNVPEGVAQVWDTQARIPLTPPLKVGSELRGAKFLSDEHVAIWGENGRVMIWDISRCRRISNVQITKEPPPRRPDPEGDQGKFWVPMNSKGYRVYWDGFGWGIEKQIPESLDYEPVLEQVAYPNMRGMVPAKKRRDCRVGGKFRKRCRQWRLRCHAQHEWRSGIPGQEDALSRLPCQLELKGNVASGHDMEFHSRRHPASIHTPVAYRSSNRGHASDSNPEFQWIT
jgi:hypothetical protein